jgi:hypothetical protein
MMGDITDLLADAALVVQQLTGMATQPAVVSPGGVVELARDTGLFVVGLSRRWRAAGLEPIHAEIAHAVPAQVLFVRRGIRPGLLTWPPPGRDPAWTTAATVSST